MSLAEDWNGSNSLCDRCEWLAVIFEGASEDGKLVYFTNMQKLTNDAVDGTASGDAYQGGYGVEGVLP